MPGQGVKLISEFLDHPDGGDIRIKHTIHTLLFLRGITIKVIAGFPPIVRMVTTTRAIPGPEIETGQGLAFFGATIQQLKYVTIETVAMVSGGLDIKRAFITIKAEFFKHHRFVQLLAEVDVPVQIFVTQLECVIP